MDAMLSPAGLKLRAYLCLIFLLASIATYGYAGDEDVKQFATSLVASIGQVPSTPSSEVLPNVTNVQVWMAVPASALVMMDRYGILNLLQTGSSQTSSSNSAIRARLSAERRASPFLKNLDKYPTNLHSKYGFLYAESPVEMTENWQEVVGNYSGVFLVFKAEVFERATYVVGDSLRQRNPKFFPMADLRALQEAIKHGGVNDYFEAQIWGPLSLADVSDIYLLKNDSLTQRTDNRKIAENLAPLADEYGFKISEIAIDNSRGGSNLPHKLSELYAPKAQRRRPFEALKVAQLLRRWNELIEPWENEKTRMVRWGDRYDFNAHRTATADEMRIIMDILGNRAGADESDLLEELLLTTESLKQEKSLVKAVKEAGNATAAAAEFFEGIVQNDKAPPGLRSVAAKIVDKSIEGQLSTGCRALRAKTKKRHR